MLSVFISYAQESEEHRAWVTQLANVLDALPDIHVVFDQYDLHAGKDLFHFIDRGLGCDRIVVVATPEYIRKAAARDGGVGYESSVISAELLENQLADRFVPALRSGDDRPLFLKSKVFVDFRDDARFAQAVRELTDALHGLAPVRRPNKKEGGTTDAGGTPQVNASREVPARIDEAPVVVASVDVPKGSGEYFGPIHVENVSERDAFNVDVGDISNGSQIVRFSRIPRLKPHDKATLVPAIDRADTKSGMPDLYRFAFVGQIGRIRDSIVDGSRAEAKSNADLALQRTFVAPFKISYIDAWNRGWATHCELIFGRDRTGNHRLVIEFRRVEPAPM